MSTQNVNRSHMFLDWLPMWILARVASSNWLKWLPKGIHLSQPGERVSHCYYDKVLRKKAQVASKWIPR